MGGSSTEVGSWDIAGQGLGCNWCCLAMSRVVCYRRPRSVSRGRSAQLMHSDTLMTSFRISVYGRVPFQCQKPPTVWWTRLTLTPRGGNKQKWGFTRQPAICSGSGGMVFEIPHYRRGRGLDKRLEMEGPLWGLMLGLFLVVISRRTGGGSRGDHRAALAVWFTQTNSAVPGMYLPSGPFRSREPQLTATQHSLGLTRLVSGSATYKCPPGTPKVSIWPGQGQGGQRGPCPTLAVTPAGPGLDPPWTQPGLGNGEGTVP